MGGLGRPAVGARLPAAVTERDRLGVVGGALHAAVAGCRDRPRDAARLRAGGDPWPGRGDPAAAPALAALGGLPAAGGVAEHPGRRDRAAAGDLPWLRPIAQGADR